MKNKVVFAIATPPLIKKIQQKAGTVPPRQKGALPERFRYLLPESWPDRNIQIVAKPAAVAAACTNPQAPMSDDNRRQLKKILAHKCLLK